MTLQEFMHENGLSVEDAATMFDVTPGVIERWLDVGVPRSRRPTVVARSRGAVTFEELTHKGDEAVLRCRRLIMSLTDYKVRQPDKGDRLTLQFYIQDLHWILDYLTGRQQP